MADITTRPKPSNHFFVGYEYNATQFRDVVVDTKVSEVIVDDLLRPINNGKENKNKENRYP